MKGFRSIPKPTKKKMEAAALASSELAYQASDIITKLVVERLTMDKMVDQLKISESPEQKETFKAIMILRDERLQI